MQLSASGTRYGAVWRSIEVVGGGEGTIRIVGGGGRGTIVGDEGRGGGVLICWLP